MKDIKKEISESIILRRELGKYFKNINWDSPKSKKFLSEFTGAILMLVPECAAFLVDQGFENKDETIHGVIASIGATLKEVGENGAEESEISPSFKN